MLVKQRLRATLEARRIDRLCWCCALGLPRYYATVQIDSYPVYKKGSEPSKRMKKNKVPANSLDPYIRKRITTLGHDEPALEKRNADLHIRHLMTNRNDVNLVRFFKSDKGPTEMKILEINEAIEEHRALCGDGGDISESGGAPIRKAYGLARTPVRKRLQIWKHARSSIRQFKKFMAVKYGAKVGASLTGAPFLFDHPVPSYRIRKFHAHGLLAEYMTGTNEATHLVRVAGPPLHQLHVSTEHEISEDSVDIGEIEGVLEFFKDLEASKSSGPKTRVDYRHYFRFFRFHPNVNSICGGENALNRPSPKFLHSRYSAHPTSWTTSRKFATATVSRTFLN